MPYATSIISTVYNSTVSRENSGGLWRRCVLSPHLPAKPNCVNFIDFNFPAAVWMKKELWWGLVWLFNPSPAREIIWKQEDELTGEPLYSTLVRSEINKRGVTITSGRFQIYLQIEHPQTTGILKDCHLHVSSNYLESFQRQVLRRDMAYW